jgi:hypothetical protein
MGAIESDTKAALSVCLIRNPPIVYTWLQSVVHIVYIYRYGQEAWSYGINRSLFLLLSVKLYVLRTRCQIALIYFVQCFI